MHAKLPRSSQDTAPYRDQAPQVLKAPEGPQGLAAVPVGGGRARAGLETRRIVLSTTGPTGMEGAGGSGGPGCGARGRWRGLAGLRADAPSRRLAARTASGRAAALGHGEQSGRWAAALGHGEQLGRQAVARGHGERG